MTVQASAYFRAVAIDYDGTLADGRVKPDTLAVLAEARDRQIHVIVVTGRILSELQAVFPDAWNHVDATVAEAAIPGPLARRPP
jgi:hydroxymethylpyrimidine pyrophosphatase-like HAD family hydrolase